MKLYPHITSRCVLAACIALAGLNAHANTLEEVTVTADFRDLAIDQLPSSITVIDQQTLQDESARHFEDVLNSIANFNWSGATSRPRYFQIRGVGEQEDYQGAPNSSVGFMVDDIDLSGLGMAASTFDVQQVEVLRGPQGTRFGANAMAGMIYLKTNDPSQDFEFNGQATLGEDNQQGMGLAVSGPMSDTLSYRVAVESQQQDGYRDNGFLGRTDTNGRDELTTRAKLRWAPSALWQIDVNYLYANLDNGYDAWTLDNNGFDTLTDQPGVDNQETQAGSLKIQWFGEQVSVTAITAGTDTDHRHAYDGDWANPNYWASKSCTDYYDENNNGDFADQIPCVYDYTWDKQASRQTLSQEFRFASTERSRLFNNSTNWLLGIYRHQLEEDNDLYSEYNTWPDEVLQSHYEATNTAVFAQTDTELSASLSLSVGVRSESRVADYRDSNGDAFSPSESMWGGHIALTQSFNDDHTGYARLARGYKAGGFNMTLPAELATKKEFETETLWNYELGLKSQWLAGRASTSATVFYMTREDQQIAASQQDPDDPQRFVLFTENAGTSDNYGVELEGQWAANAWLEVYGSIGYLQAQYGSYSYQDKYGSTVDLSGRDLAHAPRYTYSAGVTVRPANGWFANLNANGKSDFYYSDSNASQSSTFTLLNAKFGYEADQWALYAWGRNLTDAHYGVRGFYFGNEPDQDWAEKQYIRFGDPRQLGVTFNLKFQ
ncbi:TonB-dependent receptor [Simiduia aestuariiviva]|uniref:Outer membrane receptor protein involved in Fe transport n=1 Tax=Simiduia aestuariiviva TaxID=1510459 RepID=A0A839UPM1_9GAMM|nr:TonB-dependent receptor [Simiduia aestuariiviva]MBB3167377.1 outer membrane receptor protein involved in Fe transport [Simiduia aestuariiviva]